MGDIIESTDYLVSVRPDQQKGRPSNGEADQGRTDAERGDPAHAASYAERNSPVMISRCRFMPIPGTRLSADSSASWRTDPVPRTLGRPGLASRPSARASRDDADPEGAPAPPNRRPRPLFSLTSDGDKGIAKTFALSQIDHMRSIANQLYALLHPRPPLRWQPGNAACREAPTGKDDPRQKVENQVAFRN